MTYSRNPCILCKLCQSRRVSIMMIRGAPDVTCPRSSLLLGIAHFLQNLTRKILGCRQMRGVVEHRQYLRQIFSANIVHLLIAPFSTLVAACKLPPVDKRRAEQVVCERIAIGGRIRRLHFCKGKLGNLIARQGRRRDNGRLPGTVKENRLTI